MKAFEPAPQYCCRMLGEEVSIQSFDPTISCDQRDSSYSSFRRQVLEVLLELHPAAAVAADIFWNSDQGRHSIHSAGVVLIVLDSQ